MPLTKTLNHQFNIIMLLISQLCACILKEHECVLSGLGRRMTGPGMRSCCGVDSAMSEASKVYIRGFHGHDPQILERQTALRAKAHEQNDKEHRVEAGLKSRTCTRTMQMAKRKPSWTTAHKRIEERSRGSAMLSRNRQMYKAFQETARLSAEVAGLSRLLHTVYNPMQPLRPAVQRWPSDQEHPLNQKRAPFPV